MSSERALDAVAEAMEPFARSSAGPRHDERKAAQQYQLASVAVSAYLDSLLGELPEEAVEAAAYTLPTPITGPEVGLFDMKKGDATRVITAFLRSLRRSEYT